MEITNYVARRIKIAVLFRIRADYLTILPDEFPFIKLSISSSVTKLKSPYTVFLRAEAASANSSAFWSSSG